MFQVQFYFRDLDPKTPEHSWHCHRGNDFVGDALILGVNHHPAKEPKRVIKVILACLDDVQHEAN